MQYVPTDDHDLTAVYRLPKSRSTSAMHAPGLHRLLHVFGYKTRDNANKEDLLFTKCLLIPGATFREKQH